MSSTQMDLSPLVIDRKQNIASWPEGDIDQLAARDKNRYQKRKSAIIDYFQSDLSVEEISFNHRLSALDVLETMARRCCLLHEDGRQWGFRALVPGARVVEARSAPAPLSSELPQDAEATVVAGRATLFAEDEIAQPQRVSENATRVEKKDEQRAAVLKKFTELPVTPIPAGLDESAEPTSGKAKRGFSEASGEDGALETAELDVKQEEFPVFASEVVEAISDAKGEQEEFPASAGEVERVGTEDVVQEEFPVSVNEVEPVVEVAVKQEEFSEVISSEEETLVREDVRQEEFPALVGEAEVVADEEVEQEAFPGVSGSVETVVEEEVEQEAFPGVSGSVETVVEEEVEQEEFSTLISEVSAGEISVSEELELAEEDEEADGEPTGKLPVVKPGQSKPDELLEDEVRAEVGLELVPTSAPVVVEQTQLDAREGWDESDAASEEVAVAEMDTVEVAKIVVEERLKRVAATETIKVPAAMLDALEKADQELQARAGEVTASALVEAADANVADRVVAEPPVLLEQAETQLGVAHAQGEVDVATLQTQTLETWRRESRPLEPAPILKPPTQALAEDSRYRITGSQVAIKHAVRRRWGKQGRQQKYRRWVRIISAAIIVSLLVILLIPLGVGLVGYNAYTNIKNVADDGVKNLLSLNDLIPADKNNLLAALNTQKLATGKANLQKAQNDFLQLQDMVDRPDIESLLQQFAPQYSNKLDMARSLVTVALDVTRMGQELIGVAQMGATIMHGSGSLLSSNSTTPLLSADNINVIQAALAHAQYYIGDIQAQMSNVNMDQLPLGSTSQKDKLAKYLAQIPQAQSTITQVQSLIGPVAWLLGVGQPRHLLVQTLDRGELRPSGGFEGQYGLLTLQNGRMSPFSLKDITLIDYAGNGNELGATPPAQYPWMNFGNFGVRDANLSADFPTTAKIVMNYFQAEGGGPVDGVIQITPVIIEQFLHVTGPLVIKEYGETITEKNLEVKLHAYQQDPRLINVQVGKTGTDTHSTRKAFTNLVGTLLMDRIKHLPPTQLISFGKILLEDLKSRDFQIYLNNPVAQQWLTQNHYDGAMPKYTNGTDGFMVVQANISISKAAQYVKPTFKDDVTLDSQGGATHNLTIKLDYQRNNQPVYGFDTYADYLRVYAPSNARLISAYGFNTGSTLCTPGKSANKTTGTGTGSGKGNGGSNNSGSSGGAPYTDAGMTVSGCGQYYNTFADTNARYCPNGDYRLGYDGMAGHAWAVQNLGSPSSKSSDLPGYTMWGGMTLTPKDCISTITLSWYVPHIVQSTPGQAPYQMIVGHQAGWPVTAQVSIDASALKGVNGTKFNQSITVDTSISLAPLPLPNQPQQPGGTSTPAVTPTATPKKS